MKVFMIAAVSINNVIGNNNKIPWHLPEDLARFKRMTQGKVVVMGRRTYESINPPLKGRHQIVMTTQEDYPVPDGVILASSTDDVFRELKRLGHDELWVIGGHDIYNLFAAFADELYITRVLAKVEGDVRFQVSLDGWAMVDEISRPSVGDKSAYLFQIWGRV